MGIGLGIVLLLVGLILVTGVLNVNLGGIDEHGLGGIFIVVGILAIVLALVLNAQGTRRTALVDERRDEPPL
jgi:hypothetical protein